MPESNPFFHRGPVRDPAYFFGRKQEMAYLFNLLMRGQSVSICGQRRLGKTSLLFYAASPHNAARHGLDPLRTRWVHLDGGLFDGLEEEWLYGAIARELGGNAETAAYTHLAEQVRALAAQGLRLIVAFDEFELFAENVKFQPRTFNRLKALAAQFPVQYLIVSKEPLASLTFANPAIMSSPFFGFFAPLRLSLFHTQDAVEMLTALSERAGSRFKPDVIEFLLALAGPHPLFLQVAAYYAFEAQKAGALSSAARSVVREKARTELEGHLEYYWRDLTADEQYTLASFPLKGFDGSSPITNRLSEAGLLHQNGLLGIMVREFVASQIVDGLLCYGPFLMDVRRRLLTVDEQPIHLTPTEFAALRLMLQSPQRLLTPEDIEAALWPDEISPDPERARGLMKKLRTALGEAGEAIVTHRGQGYSLSFK